MALRGLVESPVHPTIVLFRSQTINVTQLRSSRPAWLSVLAKYRVSDTGKAVWQICTSIIPFLAMWCLMVLSLKVHYALTLVLCVPTVGFMVRAFIIQHDCGHGSFLKSKFWNDAIGFICGVLTLTPYHHWRKSHAIHHATASDLQRRGTGDIWTMTVAEYRSRSRWGRFIYRVYRNPLQLFVFGPPIMFIFLQRFPSKDLWRWDKERASILWTNVSLVALSAAACYVIGWKAFLMVQLPITFLAANVGTWLFYVQHQFEDTYWSQGEEWDFYQAAMQGTSFYKLPRVLQWFTGNIGFHHIHHLSPAIPNYHLPRAHYDNPSLQKVPVLTLRASLKTAFLALWDEQLNKLVSFRGAKTA